MVFEILFWFSLGTLAYVYFGFISALCVIGWFKSNTIKKKDIQRSVSIILCAYNEEKHLIQKINNCLELDFPKDQIELIIVSDGSTDKTNAILKENQIPFLKVIFMDQRHGKAECQNVAVKEARNDILFFTDATVMHPPETLKLLIRNFSDPTVGCVTGRPVFNRDEGLISEGLGKREKYEYFLRDCLGQVNTLFGAQDCIYTVPRDLYIPVRNDLDSGFVGPLAILEKGFRTVYEPDALAFVDRRPPNMKDEFIRRSRIVLRGMRGLMHMRKLMNPFQYGFNAIALISTRLLRWLTPVFLGFLFFSNIFLLEMPQYLAAFLLQCGFYSTALVGYILDRIGKRGNSIFQVPLYFCLIMCSAALGLQRLLAGETGQLWETRR